MLSNQHPDQPGCQRRRGVLRARGANTDSGSYLLVVGLWGDTRTTLESESRLAAAALGLDPGIGVLHVDTPARDSLACNLMEVVRPQVDAFLLDWITREPLKRESHHWPNGSLAHCGQEDGTQPVISHNPLA